MFGVTPQGFVRPSIQQLLDRFETDQRASIDPEFDVSPEGPQGQINGIVARQLGIAWEALEILHNAFDPDRAEGFQLTGLAKLTGTFRRPATYSVVPCDVDADEGTELLSGVHYAHVEGRPDIRFTPVEDFTAPSDGVHSGVMWRAEQTGPVQAINGNLNVIATAVVGWNGIANTADATLGREADDDATLRAAREAQLAAAGSSTLDALRADLDKLDGVASVAVFENATNATDINGVPPHAFEALIFEETAGPDPNKVAQAIWDTKPSGIRAYGTSSGTAKDALGAEHVVGYSVAQTLDVYLTFEVVKDPDNGPTDGAIAAHVAVRANELFKSPGQTVRVLTLQHLPMEMPGVLDVPSLKLGFDPAPSGEVNLPVGVREVARFDTSRIDFA